MKKLLILQQRLDDFTANDEYRAFMKYSEMKEEEVERVRTSELDEDHSFNLDNYFAVLLGGGPQNIFYPEDKKDECQKRIEKIVFRLLDEVVEKDFPFFGACLGIGFLVTHQKGMLSAKFAETVEPIVVSVTDEGKNDTIFKNFPDSFKAIVGHKESCEILPKTAKLLASGKNCPVQMFRVKENIYATQFHPELDIEGVETRITAYKHMGYFKPEDAEKLIEKAKSADLSQAGVLLKNFIDKYQK